MPMDKPDLSSKPNLTRLAGSTLLSVVVASSPALNAAADAWSSQITLRDPEDNGYVAPIHVMLLPDGELMFFAESRLTENPYQSPMIDRKEVVFKMPSPAADQILFPPEIEVQNLYAETGLDFMQPSTSPAISIFDLDQNAAWTHRDDFVCAGHVLLADGRLMVVGGTRKALKQNGTIPDVGDVTTWDDYHVFGLPYSTIYDGISWSRTENFKGQGFLGQYVSSLTGNNDDLIWRWYSTATRLADSKILITAGQDYVLGGISKYVNYGGIANLSVELFDPDTNSYELLDDNSWSSLPIYNVDYSHVFQLPTETGGRDILMLGQFGIPVMFSTTASPHFENETYRPTRPVKDIGIDDESLTTDIVGAAETAVTNVIPEPNYGAATAMLPLRVQDGEWGYSNGSVIVAGGQMDTSAHSSIDVYDPYANSWLPSLDMGVGRHHPSTVLLPNGKVLVLAGHSGEYDPNLGRAQYIDPANDFSVTTGSASYSELRGYHSISILLPDGRVLLGGGTDDKDALAEKTHLRYYSPDYIDEPRPEIYFVSDTNFDYGEYFFITWDMDTPVEEVVLMSLGSMTHSFDANQRYVQLEVDISIILPEINAGATLFKAPPNSSVAPAGDYMLFAIDGNRVPSVSKMVHLD